ncbi:MAG TPA: hypothetical protein VK119_01210 [Bacillota bacterium]|nr:hypothetical protein [Bacillota bacterium]
MKKIFDQPNRPVTYNFPPQRSISFSPAITETMNHLQLHNEIVGVPKK